MLLLILLIVVVVLLFGLESGRFVAVALLLLEEHERLFLRDGMAPALRRSAGELSRVRE